MSDVLALHLAATIQEALRLRDRMRADGSSAAACADALKQSVRNAWPKSREEPWHYVCETCQDAGWQERICRPGLRCGRPFKLPGQRPDDMTGRGRCGEEHTYTVPCYCVKGHTFAANLEKRPRSDDEDFTKATQVRQPTRFGR